MDVHQLDIFLAVLETNGATRAAQKVNLTPGAVSLQIQKLSAKVTRSFSCAKDAAWRPLRRRCGWPNTRGAW